MDDYSSLLRRLEGLGVKPGSSLPDIPDTKKVKKHVSIEDVIEGYFEISPFGDVFTVKTDYSAEYSHGLQPLIPPASFQYVWKWAKYQEPDLPDIRKVVFLDTETSGLAGGTGTFIFMIGLGTFTESGFSVTQLFLRDPSEEQAFLAVLSRLTAQFSTVVTYNGKSFDIPMLRSRHVQNHFPFEMGDWHHIDLLHLVRQVWKYSQESRTLKDMEVNILNFQRAQEEVPGWLVPQLYFEYLQSRDPSAMAGVFYHNEIDIVSLAALFCGTAQLLEYPFESIPIPRQEADLIALARIHENIESLDYAARLYATGIKNGLPVKLELPAIMRYAGFCKRNRHFEDALYLWEKAASQGCVEACLELAKFYEHQSPDLAKASRYTETALNCLPQSPLYSVRKQKEEITHRQARLMKKISQTSQVKPGCENGK